MKKPEDLPLKLKKMLMIRSLKAIPLLYELQNGGPSVDRLYKKGLLKDEMHNRFKELKAFIDTEFPEVQKEAEALAEGWGQIVWPQANQYYNIQKRKGGNEDESVDDDGESIIKSLSASASPSKKNTSPTVKSVATAAAAGAGKQQKKKSGEGKEADATKEA